MKLLKKLWHDRKGISLTEVVIAMAMVVIVTGAAISLITASVKSDAKFLAKSQALAGCENAVECVRFAYDDVVKLEEALQKVGFEKVVDPAEPHGDSVDFEEYILISGDETVKVSVTYDNGIANYVVVTYNDEIIYEKQ